MIVLPRQARDKRTLGKTQTEAVFLADGYRLQPLAVGAHATRLLCAIFILKPINCQDRLGTNDGKVGKKRRFVQVHNDTGHGGYFNDMDMLQVRKRISFALLYTKNAIILPRQARDKRRENNSEKRCVLLRSAAADWSGGSGPGGRGRCGGDGAQPQPLHAAPDDEVDPAHLDGALRCCKERQLTQLCFKRLVHLSPMRIPDGSRSFAETGPGQTQGK